MTLKALPEPYGYGTGIHVSLRGEDSEELEVVLKRYSCYPPAIPKIRNALRYSHRYDCVLQSSWFKSQRREVIRDLHAIGVDLIELSAPTHP